jgi:hypothetical protein
MTTPPLTILPVLNRTIVPDKSHSRQADTVTTKDSNASTHKLTLEVAKRIWATYSSADLTKNTVETEPAQSANALPLNLDMEVTEARVDHAASGVRLSSHLSS